MLPTGLSCLLKHAVGRALQLQTAVDDYTQMHAQLFPEAQVLHQHHLWLDTSPYNVPPEEQEVLSISGATIRPDTPVSYQELEG